jgi:hypothetical protein
MLLVYLVASNGYQGQPTLTPSFHGATYPTKEDCEAAARTVSLYSPSGTEDIGKVGMFIVCAPINPPLVQPESAPKATTDSSNTLSFPAYPPPKRVKN